jgi:hypothetical protein
VEWTSFSGVIIGKCAHGYYFVYKKLHFVSGKDRWFTEYQPSIDQFADQGGPFAASPSFENLEEALRYCEKNAQARAAAFGSQPEDGRRVLIKAHTTSAGFLFIAYRHESAVAKLTSIRPL